MEDIVPEVRTERWSSAARWDSKLERNFVPLH